MSWGQKLLRLLSPEGERLRQEMRHTMACAEAHTEDLQRTVVMDGAAIRKAISRMCVDPDATVPGARP